MMDSRQGSKLSLPHAGMPLLNTLCCLQQWECIGLTETMQQSTVP